jgi:hypothetical protein
MHFFIATFLVVLFSSNAVGMTISKELQEWLDASDRSASAAPLSIHDEALRQFQELSYRTANHSH